MLNYIISYIKKKFNFNKVSHATSDRKSAELFCKRYLSLRNGTLDMYINTKYTLPNTPNQCLITIIVLCKEPYIHNKFIVSSLSYVNDSVNFIYIMSKKYKKLNNNKLDRIQNSNNTTILFCDDNASYACMLKVAIKYCECSEYITIFTTKDAINPRSYLALLEELTENNSKSILVRADNIKAFKQKCLQNPNIESLSGIIFKAKFLLSAANNIDIRCNYWLGRVLFEIIPDDMFAIHSKRMFLQYTTNKIRIIDLAEFFYDSINIVQKIIETEDSSLLYSFIEDIVAYIRTIRNQYSLNEQLRAVLVFISAYIVHMVEKQYFPHNYELLKAQVAEVLNFDRDPRGSRAKFIHNYIVNKLIPVQDNTIAIFESEFMEDIKHSILPELENKYTVMYYTMFILNDYQVFSRMIERIKVQPAKMVIASSNVPAYARDKKPYMLLWHGLGMMKKIAFSKALVPIDYLVCSSAACIEEWSKIFLTPQSSIFDYGNISTDILHDKTNNENKRIEIRNKYKINNNDKVVFFAPTFRVQSDVAYKKRYYDFKINIEDFAQELENKGYYVITKLHHFLKSRKYYGEENFAGVYTSSNSHFVVDETYEAAELICACDIFMTDYSSTIFYAAVANKPLVLYAPDLKDYAEGFNGLIINYPEDVPASFVGEPNIDLVLKAFEDSIPLVQTTRYSEFRERHVGACDGKASERVLAKINEVMLSIK